MFRVLKPIYTKTGETTATPEGVMHWCRADFVEVGVALDMADARDKFPPGYWRGCYSLVLEEIGTVH